MKFLFLIILSANLLAQPTKYSTSNVHSHNDYKQKMPFWLAYNKGLGSIEVDIFLQDGELLVAHEAKELVYHRTLEEYYLRNLQRCLGKNGGFIFIDSSRKLQVLIDIKTDSIATLNKLIEILKGYPALIDNASLSFVITGNRPEAATFTDYPSFINFDGILSKSYDTGALQKIVLFSDNFKKYSQWKGKGRVTKKEWALLQSVTEKAHHLKKPLRFWNAPDFINAWKQFMVLGVDYINTDHIEKISSFLHTSRPGISL